ELGDRARHRIAHEEDAAERAGPPADRRPTLQRVEEAEQHDAFEKAFVELARMARLAVAVREDHGPGHVGRAAVELTVDEVGDAAEEEPDGHRADDEVAEGEHADAAAQREKNDGGDDPERAAVERHAAVPDIEDLDWVEEVVARLVEEHVAEAAAEHHAER